MAPGMPRGGQDDYSPLPCVRACRRFQPSNVSMGKAGYYVLPMQADPFLLRLSTAKNLINHFYAICLFNYEYYN